MAAGRKKTTPRPQSTTPAKGQKPAGITRKAILKAPEVRSTIDDIARRLHDEFPDPMGLCLLGIRTGGVILAERLRERLEKLYGQSIGFGILDITLYRDDLSSFDAQPLVRDSEIPFNIHNAKVILVDDVIYTGRTIRAALDEIVDFGRPALIRLVVLVDRGLREYPIQPDVVGLKVDSKPPDSIRIQFREIDGRDGVTLLSPK